MHRVGSVEASARLRKSIVFIVGITLCNPTSQLIVEERLVEKASTAIKGGETGVNGAAMRVALNRHKV